MGFLVIVSDEDDDEDKKPDTHVKHWAGVIVRLD